MGKRGPARCAVCGERTEIGNRTFFGSKQNEAGENRSHNFPNYHFCPTCGELLYTYIKNIERLKMSNSICGLCGGETHKEHRTFWTIKHTEAGISKIMEFQNYHFCASCTVILKEMVEQKRKEMSNAQA